MPKVISIDFGTSAIRSAYRDEQGNRVVLPLGQVTGSRSIDEASIRSEIHIDSQGLNVRFGENAFIARSKLRRTPYYQASPKLWLLQPERIDDPAFLGLKISRRCLIYGLISYALWAVQNAFVKLKINAKVDDCEIRIAHPVWANTISEKSNKILLDALGIGCAFALRGEWEEISVDNLVSSTRPVNLKKRTASNADVIEPVAAAIELLPTQSNLRRICTVVDIGAGTTDIGVFQALTPLKESRSKNKLIPCGPTRSVFKAGNEIDEVVLEMLTSHSHISGNERYDLEARIRQIKESLFDNGFVREYGVRLEVDELVQHPRMKAMVIEIRKCLEDVIASNVSTLSIWTGLKSNFQEHVDLIMAGGGGGIDFIIKALCKPLLINKTLMGVARCETLFDRSIIIYGAGIGRMAVALGGSNINYDNLQHEYTKIISIPSLGFPKQVISSVKSSASTADTLSEKVHHSLKAVAEGELRKQQAREAAERIRRQRWQEQYQIHAVATAREGPEAGYLFVEFLLADDAIRFMDECLSILHRGALGRHTKSQIKLATLLENRREASSDLEDAFYWFCCAGYSGHAIYLKDAERLASNLNTDRCDYLRLQAMRLSASTNIKATSQRGFSENDRKLERVSLETRAFDDNKGPISQHNIPNQNSRAESTFPEGGDSSLEKLRVLSLVLRARSLRKPTLPIESEKELLRWSTVKNPIEAYFMATYLGITAPKPNFNDKTLQITLERWIRISRLVD